MAASAYVLIIEASIISWSKTGTLYLDRGVTQPVRSSKEVHLVGFDQCLPPNKDQGRWRVEDGFLNQIQLFWISDDAIRIIQRSG